MSSNPDFDSCWTQAGLAIKVINEIEKFGASNSANLLGMQDALRTGIDGEYTPQALNLIGQLRGQQAAAVRPDFLRQLWRPFLQEMCRAVNLNELAGGSDTEMLAAIREYMADNSLSLNSRGMTLNSPAASGSPTGNGAVYRVTVDENGEPLECTGAEAKTATCIRDSQSGARIYEELFEFEGTPPSIDGISWEGSGLSVEIPSAHPATAKFVKNPSFDTNDASSDDVNPGSTTGVTSWTIASAASNYKLRSSSTYVYGGYPNAPSTPWGLELEGDDTISQQINSVSPGQSFDPAVPYFWGIRWKRLASATGNLLLDFGAQTATVDVSTGTNGVWNLLIPTLGTANWFANFNEADMDVRIRTTSLATGTVAVDQLIVAPFVNFDGTWVLPISGSTKWLRDDAWTWTDSDGGTRAILSYWLWRAFGPAGWLPTDNGGTETQADPA